jgi:hypothetical protein
MQIPYQSADSSDKANSRVGDSGEDDRSKDESDNVPHSVVLAEDLMPSEYLSIPSSDTPETGINQLAVSICPLIPS